MNSEGIATVAISVWDHPTAADADHHIGGGLLSVHLAGVVLAGTGMAMLEPGLADLVTAYVADPSQLGVAQGVTNSLRNVASIVAPLLVSWVYDTKGIATAYISCMMVPSLLAACAIAGAAAFGEEVDEKTVIAESSGETSELRAF